MQEAQKRDSEAAELAAKIEKEKKEMQEIVREIEVPGPSFQSEKRREKRPMDAPIEKWIFAADDVSQVRPKCFVRGSKLLILRYDMNARDAKNQVHDLITFYSTTFGGIMLDYTFAWLVWTVDGVERGP